MKETTINLIVVGLMSFLLGTVLGVLYMTPRNIEMTVKTMMYEITYEEAKYEVDSVIQNIANERGLCDQ